MIAKTLTAMTFAAVAGVAGDLLLSKGMKELGDVSALGSHQWGAHALRVMANPKIWAGTACLGAFFFIWLSVLSWAELSFALPLQALTFVITPFLAQMYLGEQVSAVRWAGTVLISIGTVLVSLKS